MYKWIQRTFGPTANFFNFLAQNNSKTSMLHDLVCCFSSNYQPNLIKINIIEQLVKVAKDMAEIYSYSYIWVGGSGWGRVLNILPFLPESTQSQRQNLQCKL